MNVLIKNDAKVWVKKKNDTKECIMGLCFLFFKMNKFVIIKYILVLNNLNIKILVKILYYLKLLIIKKNYILVLFFIMFNK
jgi:hypothetical protein